jgi:hypothetical protein
MHLLRLRCLDPQRWLGLYSPSKSCRPMMPCRSLIQRPWTSLLLPPGRPSGFCSRPFSMVSMSHDRSQSGCKYRSSIQRASHISCSGCWLLLCQHLKSSLQSPLVISTIISSHFTRHFIPNHHIHARTQQWPLPSCRTQQHSTPRLLSQCGTQKITPRVLVRRTPLPRTPDRPFVCSPQLSCPLPITK